MTLQSLKSSHQNISVMEIPSHPFATPGMPQGAVAAPRWSKLFGDDGLSFRDVLDLVNPLQHIPVVGNLYRRLTGDTLDPAIQVAGGALFGGPLGAVLSLGSLLIEQVRETDPASVTAGSRALAETSRSQPYRGGWMVNAAMTGQRPLMASSAKLTAEASVECSAKIAEPNNPEIRRGGWMVVQAYALSDLRRGAASAPAGRIDDTV